MEKLKEYISTQAKAKGKSEKEWLNAAFKNLDKCVLATHVGKFTNPDSKVCVLDNSAEKISGYVSTKGTNVGTDICVNSAAYLTIANLLLLKLSDEKTLLDHIIEKDERVYQLLNIYEINLQYIEKFINNIINNNTANNTEGFLRQVYFPLGEDEYELLTVMPSSSLMIELDRRIKKIIITHRECINSNNEKYGNPHDYIKNLVYTSFGGSQPQNISSLNSKYGGKFSMLKTLPPKWNKKTRIPKVNFFGEIIYYKNVEYELKKLKKLLLCDRNNVSIRKKIADLIDIIVDEVVYRCYELRDNTGWSDLVENISQSQKLWLDNYYIEDRKNDDKWISEVSFDFGRWLIRSLDKIDRDKKVVLGDAELAYFASRLSDVLKEEKRCSL